MKAPEFDLPHYPYTGGMSPEDADVYRVRWWRERWGDADLPIEAGAPLDALPWGLRDALMYIRHLSARIDELERKLGEQ